MFLCPVDFRESESYSLVSRDGQQSAPTRRDYKCRFHKSRYIHILVNTICELRQV